MNKWEGKKASVGKKKRKKVKNDCQKKFKKKVFEHLNRKAKRVGVMHVRGWGKSNLWSETGRPSKSVTLTLGGKKKARGGEPRPISKKIEVPTG